MSCGRAWRRWVVLVTFDFFWLMKMNSTDFLPESALAYSDHSSTPIASGFMSVCRRKVLNTSTATKNPNLHQYDAFTGKRFAAFLKQAKCTLLCILAHSPTFRTAAFTLRPSPWAQLFQTTTENAASLETFAKVRGIPSSLLLTHITDSILPSHLPSPPPTSRSFCGSYRCNKPIHHSPPLPNPTHHSIPSTLYTPLLFPSPASPPYPPTRPFPTDPTLRATNPSTPCISCTSTTRCACTVPTSSFIAQPLTELRRYGRKGVGVRALQRIRAGSVLGEYVGVLMPKGRGGEDGVYGFEVPGDGEYGSNSESDGGDVEPGREGSSTGHRHNSGNGNGEGIAIISAARYGNWTRYINHSCAANCYFWYAPLGRTWRVFVVAGREVQWGEEVTVGYGRGYWRGREGGCFCGEVGCMSEGGKR